MRSRYAAIFVQSLAGVLLFVLVGCQHVAVSAQPAELARHAAELAATGRARVEVEEGGTVSVAARDRVVVTIPGDQRSDPDRTGAPDETVEITIGTLVAGCAHDVTRPDCIAGHAQGSTRLGTRRYLDSGRLGVGVFGVLTTVVGAICLATCSDRTGWAFLGTGVGMAVMLVPLSTVY